MYEKIIFNTLSHQYICLFFKKDATIDAHNAKPNLNQNNHFAFHALTWYVLVLPRDCLTL